MGVNYLVLTLDSDTREWLRREGIPEPDDSARSRWPSPNELKDLLSQLPSHTVRFTSNSTGGWDADITDEHGRRATIWVEDVQNPDAPHRFKSHKPHPAVLVTVLKHLSSSSGPYVVVNTSNMRPAIVSASCSQDEVLSLLES